MILPLPKLSENVRILRIFKGKFLQFFNFTKFRSKISRIKEKVVILLINGRKTNKMQKYNML